MSQIKYLDPIKYLSAIMYLSERSADNNTGLPAHRSYQESIPSRETFIFKKINIKFRGKYSMDWLLFKYLAFHLIIQNLVNCRDVSRYEKYLGLIHEYHNAIYEQHCVRGNK